MNTKQREELKKYILENAHSSMFGDGMEQHYLLNGFPQWKGINNLTDQELLDHAADYSDAVEVQALMDTWK